MKIKSPDRRVVCLLSYTLKSELQKFIFGVQVLTCKISKHPPQLSGARWKEGNNELLSIDEQMRDRPNKDRWIVMERGNIQKGHDWFLELEKEMKKHPLDLEEIDRMFRHAIRSAAMETETTEILEKILSKTKELINLGKDDNDYRTFIMEEVIVLLAHTNPTIRANAAAVVVNIVVDAVKTNRIKMRIKWL